MGLCIKLLPLALLSLCLSTSSAQPKRKDLMTALVNQQVSIAEIQEITLVPGQAAPKHLHPCSVVGYLVKGRVLFQCEGGKPVILEEGDGFFEPRNKTVLHFDNLTQRPVTFIAIYLKEDKEETIKLLD